MLCMHGLQTLRTACIYRAHTLHGPYFALQCKCKIALVTAGRSALLCQSLPACLPSLPAWLAAPHACCPASGPPVQPTRRVPRPCVYAVLGITNEPVTRCLPVRGRHHYCAAPSSRDRQHSTFGQHTIDRANMFVIPQFFVVAFRIDGRPIHWGSNRLTRAFRAHGRSTPLGRIPRPCPTRIAAALPIAYIREAMA